MNGQMGVTEKHESERVFLNLLEIAGSRSSSPCCC